MHARRRPLGVDTPAPCRSAPLAAGPFYSAGASGEAPSLARSLCFTPVPKPSFNRDSLFLSVLTLILSRDFFLPTSFIGAGCFEEIQMKDGGGFVRMRSVCFLRYR